MLEDDQSTARWPGPDRNAVLEEDSAFCWRGLAGLCRSAKAAAGLVGSLKVLGRTHHGNADKTLTVRM